MAQINEILSTFVFNANSTKTKTYAILEEMKETRTAATTEASKAISCSVTYVLQCLKVLFDFLYGFIRNTKSNHR